MLKLRVKQFCDDFGVKTPSCSDIVTSAKEWYKSVFPNSFKNESKNDYLADIICGLTVGEALTNYAAGSVDKDVIVKSYKGFIRLPLAMAHGMLSDLPIEYGIYSDLFGCIFFTLFSTSRHTSAGSAAFLMMIIGSSIENKFQYFFLSICTICFYLSSSSNAFSCKFCCIFE